MALTWAECGQIINGCADRPTEPTIFELMEEFEIHDEASNNSDGDLERVLRPKRFDDFTGQRQVLDNLQVFECFAGFENGSFQILGRAYFPK